MLQLMLLTVLVAHASIDARPAPARQSATSASQSAAATPWPPAGVYRPLNGVTPPRLIKAGRPDYTPEAMRAKVQGAVKLEIVVKTDGTVGDSRIVRSLDRVFGLDDAAIKSLKDYPGSPVI